MDKSQITTVISISLAIIGPIIGIFKDEIVNYLFGGKKYNYLVGSWSCEWTENPGKINPQGKTVSDTVIIKKVIGKLVKGNGSTGDLGDWTINGEVSECALTISYKAKKDNLKHHLGVVILDVNQSNKNILKGKWFQSNGRELVGGDAFWKKNA